MKARHITAKLMDSLQDSPAVFLQGARQTGKSTLVQALAAGPHPARYLTFDEASTLAVAQEDPQGFIAGLRGAVVIDEVQRVPDVALAIKQAVDRSRDPGRFLLTGSASVLVLPKISEALAGRIEIHTLWPLSQGEIDGGVERFVEMLFDDDFATWVSDAASPSPDDALEPIDRVLRGGFPVILTRTRHERRRAWFDSYVTTLLQRDVRDLSSIEGLAAMPRLLSLLAARTGSLLNYAEISRSLSMSHSTLKRYTTLLEMTFLVQLLPAWSANLGKRLVKSPKIYLADTGLLCHSMGLDCDRLAKDRSLFGHILENFTVMELRKQLGWTSRAIEMYHFRTAAGEEVDVLLVEAGGAAVGVEIKASTTIRGEDVRGLRALRDLLGRRFRRGVLLYLGTETLPLGTDLHAVPLPRIWASAE